MPTIKEQLKAVIDSGILTAAEIERVAKRAEKAQEREDLAKIEALAAELRKRAISSAGTQIGRMRIGDKMFDRIGPDHGLDVLREFNERMDAADAAEGHIARRVWPGVVMELGVRK